MSRGDFVPAWWVPGAHMQTLWGKLARKTPRAATQLELWTAPDGQMLELHRISAPHAEERIVLLHGLEGSVRSHYAQGLFWEAKRRGWNADLLVFRSCGEAELSQPRLYHSGDTADVDWVLNRIISENPRSRIGLLGVSLGGNVLLKYLGEKGSAVSENIRGAVAISVPFDLERSSRHIDRGFARVYQWHFLRTLRTKARDVLERFPGKAEIHRVAAARNMFEYDDLMTAPLHGFNGATDYYTKSSSIHWLDKIRVPTLLLSAVDDPFLPPDVLDNVKEVAAKNPMLHREFHANGGHVGFVSGNNPRRPIYYAEQRATDFVSQLIT